MSFSFRMWLEAKEGFKQWFLDIFGIKADALDTVNMGDIADVAHKLEGYKTQLRDEWGISQATFNDAFDFAKRPEFQDRNIGELLKKFTDANAPVLGNTPPMPGMQNQRGMGLQQPTARG